MQPTSYQFNIRATETVTSRIAPLYFLHLCSSLSEHLDPPKQFFSHVLRHCGPEVQPGFHEAHNTTLRVFPLGLNQGSEL